MANGPKPKPRPSASKLDAILSTLKIAVPAMFGPAGSAIGQTALASASKFSLNRMAKNLNPYDYNVGGKSAASRFFNTVVLNKPEAAREETDKYIEKGYGMQPGVAYKERVDLLQMLAGKPQKYNTIEPSQYIPDIDPEKYGRPYYRSRGIESEIVKDLQLDKANIKSEKDLEEIIRGRALASEDTGEPVRGKKGYVAIIPGLGGATYNFKRDKKGIYLDYRDLWDLDPRKGAYAEEKKAQTTTVGKLYSEAEDFLKGAATNIVNTMATPTKVYGRIYFDPKTGKPILENRTSKMPAERVKKVLSNKTK